MIALSARYYFTFAGGFEVHWGIHGKVMCGALWHFLCDFTFDLPEEAFR